jgi:pSer/pThr/pTyr-binding forkhead associated (FHA) protein
VKASLHIRTAYEERTVELGDELSIGRTDLANLVLDDTGLSRVNTTFFRDDDDILVADENSTNGTFVNGQKVTGRPRVLSDGDEIRIGSNTTIRISIGEAKTAEPRTRIELPIERPVESSPIAPQSRLPEKSEGDGPPMILIAAALLTFAIILIGGLAILVVSMYQNEPGNRTDRPTPQISSTALIPVRVIDPLGGEDEDDLDDLIASWEVAEDEIKAENVGDVKVESADVEEKDLNVTAAFLKDRQAKALEDRPGEKGVSPSGLNVPAELRGDGVIKQKAKLREMNTTGYQQPMDFADLAEKRIEHKLIEMPMAAESFYLDVGGSAKESLFTSFSFKDGAADIAPGSPKFEILSKLASNFAGQKYDLNNPSDRRQMRMRLLRMFNPTAKPILKELADAYFKKFGRPLRVTSLTRSMDYQIGLNASNPNSFKVRGEGSLPPHTSGCAFDLARKHMPAEEQNFVMQKLAEMENAGRLDALIEYGVNACFHIFIYADGHPPKM